MDSRNDIPLAKERNVADVQEQPTFEDELRSTANYIQGRLDAQKNPTAILISRHLAEHLVGWLNTCANDRELER